MDTCKVCGGPLTPPLRGPMPSHCSGRCRQRAYKARLVGMVTTGAKTEPRAVPVRQRKPSVEDITRLVVETAGVEESFRFASERAEFRLRPMCSRMSSAIGDALDKEGLR